MPNINPFASDVEDTSFEQGAPISQAAKNAAKAASAHVQDDTAANKKAILDQLYGPSDPSAKDQNTNATANKSDSFIDTTTGMQADLPTGSDASKTPQEQAQIAKVRSALFGNYSGKFQPAPNGAHGLITNIDQEMEKARQERKQKEAQRKQEEEEEEQRKKEEEEAKKQELAMPAGKKSGVMFGRKQQQPIELERARTKTEINRGTSG